MRLHLDNEWIILTDWIKDSLKFEVGLCLHLWKQLISAAVYMTACNHVGYAGYNRKQQVPVLNAHYALFYMQR